MDSETLVVLAGIASGAVITPVVTALLTRRLLGEQQVAERESTDLVEARRIIMEFAATTVEFDSSSRQYGRELERVMAKENGQITDGLRFARRQLDDGAFHIGIGAGTFWHMVGAESGVATAHRAIVSQAKSMASLAARIEEAGLVDSADLEQWQVAASKSSLEFKRFAAAIGGMVGFRLPGATING